MRRLLYIFVYTLGCRLPSKQVVVIVLILSRSYGFCVLLRQFTCKAAPKGKLKIQWLIKFETFENGLKRCTRLLYPHTNERFNYQWIFYPRSRQNRPLHLSDIDSNADLYRLDSRSSCMFTAARAIRLMGAVHAVVFLFNRYFLQLTLESSRSMLSRLLLLWMRPLMRRREGLPWTVLAEEAAVIEPAVGLGCILGGWGTKKKMLSGQASTHHSVVFSQRDKVPQATPQKKEQEKGKAAGCISSIWKGHRPPAGENDI